MNRPDPGPRLRAAAWPALLVLLMLALVLALAVTGSTAAADPDEDIRLGVSTVTLRHQPSHEVLRHYAGEVRPGRASELGFAQAGTLHRLQVSEGDRVAAGQLLASLDPAPLQARQQQRQAALELAQAATSAANAQEALARAGAERQQRLYEREQVSRQVFDEARLTLQAREAERMVAEAEAASARASLRESEVALAQTRLKAPFAGSIQTRHKDLGTAVAAGDPVLRLVGSEQREARIGLPAEVAATLDPEQEYRFRSRNGTLTGRLLGQLPELDGRTATLPVRFLLDPEAAPAAGSLVELELRQQVPKAGFWLPIAALTEAQRGLWSAFAVIGEDDDLRIERRLVDVLHIQADQAFVRGTLADGDRIVATGARRVVPGQAVRIVESRQ